jgi:hypothetical protein
LAVSRIPKKRWWHRQKYTLHKPLEYAAKCGILIVVPIGFVTDFATWIKPRGRYDVASVLHDWLYHSRAGRRYADKIFKEAMVRAGCSRARINMMYYGVRCFGWIPYYFGGRKNG